MRRLFFIILVAITGNSAYAQINSNSPFSSFGLGELGGLDHPATVGIGNSNITLLDSVNVNYYNPASYNLLSKGQPLFSLAGASRISNYTEGGVSSTRTVANFQHFALAVPVRKHFGLAFGLKPYSRKGYDINTRNAVGADSVKYNYSGSGGLNEVFLGISTDVLRLKSTRMSIGGNFGYIFGTSVNSRSATVIGAAQANAGGVDHRSIRARSFHYELGTYLTHKFNQKHSLMASATFDPGQNLSGQFSYGRFYSASNVANTNSYDTLFFSGDSSGRIKSVPTYTYGLRYTLSRPASLTKSRKLNTEVSFHATYSTSNWSNFSVPFDTSSVFLNSSKYTFGIQYIPEVYHIANKATTKFYQRIRYRIGVYYQTLPYQSAGEQITDFGTTFGLGLPIAIQKSLSSVNFGFSYGNRGNSNSHSLKEQYYGINVGITIAPGGDRWFVKRKLD